jgi:hypothetical protein
MKKISINVFILVATYLVPEYILSLAQDDIRKVENIQYQVLFVTLIGAIILTFLNHKYRKQALEKKWIWTIFEIIGVLGVLYAGTILLILFSFRNGIGF